MCLPILLLYVHKARVENDLGDIIVSGIGEKTSCSSSSIVLKLEIEPGKSREDFEYSHSCTIDINTVICYVPQLPGKEEQATHTAPISKPID